MELFRNLTCLLSYVPFGLHREMGSKLARSVGNSAILAEPGKGGVRCIAVDALCRDIEWVGPEFFVSFGLLLC